MKERPILFSAPMVRAIIEGRKTQTRRIVKPRKDAAFGCLLQPHELAGEVNAGSFENCPFGNPGDRLWVREAFRFLDSFDKDSPLRVGEMCLLAGYPKPWAPTLYEADGWRDNWINVGTVPGSITPGKLRPGIHMPRWASRILLEVTAVRVERLHDISEADSVAEGIQTRSGPIYPDEPRSHYVAKDLYRDLWDSINDAGSWDANPWVWVVEFKQLTGGAA